MRDIKSDEARRDWRDLLDEVQADRYPVRIMRYDKPVAVLVPAPWHEQAVADLLHFKPEPMSQRCRDGAHGGTGDDRCVNCWCLCHWGQENDPRKRPDSQTAEKGDDR